LICICGILISGICILICIQNFAGILICIGKLFSSLPKKHPIFGEKHPPPVGAFLGARTQSKFLVILGGPRGAFLLFENVPGNSKSREKTEKKESCFRKKKRSARLGAERFLLVAGLPETRQR